MTQPPTLRQRILLHIASVPGSTAATVAEVCSAHGFSRRSAAVEVARMKRDGLVELDVERRRCYGLPGGRTVDATASTVESDVGRQAVVDGQPRWIMATPLVVPKPMRYRLADAGRAVLAGR